MSSFKAILIEKTDAGQSVRVADLVEADLMVGDTLVRVTHSTVNYKDGLAITGRSPVVRRFPMVPGVDFCGVVERSTDAAFRPGDRVILNGWGVGETHWGGYAGMAQLKADWLVPLPAAFTAAQAMAIGTAGYTAMLAVMALEAHGVSARDGAAIVTGAAGGVGSVAVALLARLGWRVIASTGRSDTHDYLRSLGATDILERRELEAPGRPLGKERWAAGIDSVGSTTLGNVLAQTRAEGAIAACGLAGGMDLPATVAPFILRGVSLLGINSVTVPRPKRIAAWSRLARDLDPEALAAITRTIGFEDIIPTAHAIVEGKVRGRVVVEIDAS